MRMGLCCAYEARRPRKPRRKPGPKPAAAGRAAAHCEPSARKRAASHHAALTAAPLQASRPRANGGAGPFLWTAEEEAEVAPNARWLASVMCTPGEGGGGDQNPLDCELGLIRTLTARDATGRAVPVELLREWAQVGLVRRDCGLLGRAMALASAAGLGLAEVLLAPERALEDLDRRAESAWPTGAEAQRAGEAAAGGAPEGSPVCPVVPVGSDGAAAALPASISAWIHGETSAGQLVLVKQVAAGRVRIFTNKAFETHVATATALQASWASKGVPTTEAFVHPDDTAAVSAAIGKLWEGLSPAKAADGGDGGATERASFRDVPGTVRLAGGRSGSSSRRGATFVPCAARARLVVRCPSAGAPVDQASFLILSFRAPQFGAPPASDEEFEPDPSTAAPLTAAVATTASSSASACDGPVPLYTLAPTWHKRGGARRAMEPFCGPNAPKWGNDEDFERAAARAAESVAGLRLKDKAASGGAQASAPLPVAAQGNILGPSTAALGPASPPLAVDLPTGAVGMQQAMWLAAAAQVSHQNLVAQNLAAQKLAAAAALAPMAFPGACLAAARPIEQRGPADLGVDQGEFWDGLTTLATDLPPRLPEGEDVARFGEV